MSTYAPDMVLHEARTLHFARNGLGPDGGYDDDWGTFAIGRIVIPFPNSPSRVRVLHYHDVHHIVTGYGTDTLSELELSAWEIGAGCKDYWVSWQLDLSGLAAGLVFIPRRTFRAFVRGRRTRTLFGRDVQALFDRRVGEVAAELGLDRSAYEARTTDVVLLFAAAIAGFAVIGVTVVLLLVGGPLMFIYFKLRRRGTAAKPLARAYRAPEGAPATGGTQASGTGGR